MLTLLRTFFRLHKRFWCTSCQMECVCVRFSRLTTIKGYCLRCNEWRRAEMTTNV